MDYLTPFPIDPEFIESNIFSNEREKSRGRCKLNVKYLPNLFWYIKSLLNEKERSSIKDYEAQVCLIETALHAKKLTDLQSITEYILNELRSNVDYWILGTEPYFTALEQIEDPDEKAHLQKIANNYNASECQRKQEASFDAFKKYHCDLEKLFQENNFIAPQSNENVQEKADMNMEEEVSEEEQPKFDKEVFSLAVDKVLDSKAAINNNWSSRTRTKVRFNKTLAELDEDVMQNYIEMVKIARDHDINERQTIFAATRRKNIPKIDAVLFPYIFQFVESERQSIFASINEKVPQMRLNLRLQNLIMSCLLADEPTPNLDYRTKLSKALFFDPTPKNASDQLMKVENPSPDMIKIEKSNQQESDEQTSRSEVESPFLMLEKFEEFCNMKGMKLRSYYSQNLEIAQRQRVLLNNVLQLGISLVDQIGNSVNFRKVVIDEEQRELKVEQTVLNNLELIPNLTPSLVDDLVKYQVASMENFDYDNKKEMLQTYLGLKVRNEKLQPAEGYQEPLSGLNLSMSPSETNQRVVCYKKYVNDPQSIRKRSYKFHSENSFKWTPAIFKKFLQGLSLYFDTPLNNRKIAKYMGPNIHPNHVRYVKGRFLRSLRHRSKVRMIPKRDLLKEDIQSNDIEALFKSLLEQ